MNLWNCKITYVYSTCTIVQDKCINWLCTEQSMCIRCEKNVQNWLCNKQLMCIWCENIIPTQWKIQFNIKQNDQIILSNSKLWTHVILVVYHLSIFIYKIKQHMITCVPTKATFHIIGFKHLSILEKHPPDSNDNLWKKNKPRTHKKFDKPKNRWWGHI